MIVSAQSVQARAVELGFNLVGITRAEPSLRLDAYFRWIDHSMHGTMGYMAREDRQARRRDLNMILPGMQSLIMVGLDYHALNIPDNVLTDPSRGRIAAYAWGVDYHDVMTPRLEALAGWLRDISGQSIAHRVYVDTGAILERSHAQQAGMGFVGKNTMLIHPRRGSYFFLGEILTDAVFDAYDQPHRETMCGSCIRCQVACPTNAFPKPYVLDARRCISYLTIENKGWINRDLRPLMGNWVYGCDVCQDVCPFNRFALPTRESAFLPTDVNRAAPPLLDLLHMDDAAFKARFAGSPIARIKRERLVRNACVAAGNWGNAAAVPALIDLLRDPSPLVRGHAVWALARIQGEDNRSALLPMLDRELDPQVQDEIHAALQVRYNAPQN
ncbi:MAG: tRNA epoxyqueuosine(34) reductase QueG [Anaerolineae bacterium]|nr:tRNA epoxyqueuosine(34) reductase QueG [Anaerolineae bacterium]